MCLRVYSALFFYSLHLISFLKKIVSSRLLKFLEKENILFDGQLGFRATYSTDNAVLSITNKVQQALGKGELSCGIF